MNTGMDKEMPLLAKTTKGLITLYVVSLAGFFPRVFDFFRPHFHLRF